MRPKNKLRVGIIENDPVFTLLLKKELENLGIQQIDTFSSGIPAIFSENWRPDLIFIDFKMNDLNGVRTAKSIKYISPKATIVLMSSSLRILKINKRKYGLQNILLKEIGVQSLAKKGLNTYYQYCIKKLVFKITIAILILLLSAYLLSILT